MRRSSVVEFSLMAKNSRSFQYTEDPTLTYQQFCEDLILCEFDSFICRTCRCWVVEIMMSYENMAKNLMSFLVC